MCFFLGHKSTNNSFTQQNNESKTRKDSVLDADSSSTKSGRNSFFFVLISIVDFSIIFAVKCVFCGLLFYGFYFISKIKIYINVSLGIKFIYAYLFTLVVIFCCC